MTAGLCLTRLKFQRAMHMGGRRRSFPVEAEAFVRGEGAVVAAVLREETALSFAEIVTACREYVLEHAEEHGAQPLTEVDIAIALLRLLDWGWSG